MNHFLKLADITHPVVQGPFGGGISTPELTAAVSNGGGLGSFGLHHLSPAGMHATAEAIRRLTPGPFNLNLWVSPGDADASLDYAEMHRSVWLPMFAPLYEEQGVAAPSAPLAPEFSVEQQYEAILEIRPKVASFVFGVPPAAFLAHCRQLGILTVGTATTPAEALAIEAAGMDAVVASGCEAGGHRTAFLRPAEEHLIGTLPLIPMVADAVSIPVIAAGGIADQRGLRAVQALGAAAAQVGTAFLACEESGTTPAHRAALQRGFGEGTEVSRSMTGRLARFLRNALLTRLQGLPHLPFPLQSHYLAPLKQLARTSGDESWSPGHYSGQAAPLIRHTKAADLLASLVG
jgi:nitronate monooxygenase